MTRSSKTLDQIKAEALDALIGMKKNEAQEEKHTSVHIHAMPVLGESNPAILFLSRFNGQSFTTHTSRLRRISKLLGAPNQDFRYLDWAHFTAVKIDSLLNEQREPTLTEEREKEALRSPTGHASQLLLEGPKGAPVAEKKKIDYLSESTLSGFLDTLKGVMKQAYKLEIISQREWSDIQDIKPKKVQVPMAGRMASASETKAIEELIDNQAKANPAKAARDRAIFRLAFLAGLRRHEFSNLDYTGYNESNGTIRVKGKGGKIVDLEIGRDVIDAINLWLEFRGEFEGCLFFRVLRNGEITQDPLSPEGIRYLFKTYSTKLGLKKLTPHDARRTFCSNVLDDPEMDSKTAMDLLRHSSFDTSTLYDRRDGSKRSRIANRLSMK